MRIVPFLILASATALACSTEVTTFSGTGGGTSTTSTSSGTNSSGTNTGSSSTGGTNYGACSANAECILQEPGCCSSCDELTLNHVEPINQSQSMAFRDATCSTPNEPCPACATLDNPNLFAYCDAGQCQEADVELEPWNQCEENDDCVLRSGLDCCEACTADYGTIVAVPTSHNQLLDKVCDGDVGCPECAPTYPEGAKAECDQGVCRVVISDF